MNIYLRTFAASAIASSIMFAAGRLYERQQQLEPIQGSVLQVSYGRPNHSMDWLDGADRWLLQQGASGDVDGSDYRSFDPWQRSDRRVRSSSWKRRYNSRSCY